MAWAFNIRGSDIPHNPVALAFAIIPQSGKPELFIAPEKLDAGCARASQELCKGQPARSPRRPTCKPCARPTSACALDPQHGELLRSRARLVGPDALRAGADPSLALKAVKNAAEIKGARAAQRAMAPRSSRFLAWLDGAIAPATIDEIETVRRLEGFRRATNQLREISFDTISGSGPNGAIVHYRVNDATNRKLRAGELFLIDSGAQYQDGTTDITRTVAIGRAEPTRCASASRSC